MHMTYFNLLYRGFFDPNTYRHMHRHYRGSGFGYLFFLIAIITAIYVICALQKTHATFLTPQEKTGQSVAQNYLNQIATQIPEIIIQDGILTTPAPQPYTIHLDVADETVPIAVIDVNADARNFLDEGHPPILITAEAAHGRDDNTIESLYYTEMELAEGEPFYLNSDIAQRLAQQAIVWLDDNWLSNAVILFLVFWAFFVIIWLIWASFIGLFWALIVKLVARMMKHPLAYEDALRLTFLILTPAYLIQTVMANSVRNADFTIMPGSGISLLLYVLILLGTSIFAVHSIRGTNDLIKQD